MCDDIDLDAAYLQDAGLQPPDAPAVAAVPAAVLPDAIQEGDSEADKDATDDNALAAVPPPPDERKRGRAGSAAHGNAADAAASADSADDAQAKGSGKRKRVRVQGAAQQQKSAGEDAAAADIGQHIVNDADVNGKAADNSREGK